MTREFNISKIEAAKRQLETAIRLYFSEGDAVSTHTLTAAAYNVLRDVTNLTGADPVFIKGHMLDMVKSEYRRQLIDKTNEAENFFKHADRDHEASLHFDPEMTELHLIDACVQFQKLTGDEPALFLIYRVWFSAHHPNLFILPDELKSQLENIGPSIAQMGRGEYFNAAVPLFARLRSTGTAQP